MAISFFINMSATHPNFPDFQDLNSDSSNNSLNKVLTKRTRDNNDYYYEEEEELRPTVKKYLSEEQMSNHLQSLHLATPPYVTTPPHHQTPPYVAATAEEPPNHWLDLFTSEGERNDFLQPKLELFENFTNTDPNNDNTHLFHPEHTHLFHPEHTHPSYIDHTYLSSSYVPSTEEECIEEETTLTEDDNESRDHKSSSSSRVWIAPEIRSLLNNDKKKLLPTSILSEMNKPCTSLVLYKQPDTHIQETLWKKHILESLETNKEDDEKGRKEYIVEEPNDTSSMLFSTQKSWTSEDDMEL